MPEHEVLERDSTMALTLLRCVDILGDLPPAYWEKNQMIDDFTPGAQCQRDYKFRYALLPFAGKAEDANLRLECDRFLHPPRMVQLQLERNAWLGIRPGAGKFFDYFDDVNSLIPEPPAVEPTEKSFLTLDNPYVALSAVKFPEHGEVPGSGEKTAVVRIVNYTESVQRVSMKSSYPIARAENWLLGEEPTGLLPVEGNSVELEIAPKSIRTVALFLKASK
jgi:alpha-mannosidase